MAGCVIPCPVPPCTMCIIGWRMAVVADRNGEASNFDTVEEGVYTLAGTEEGYEYSKHPISV